MTLPDGRRSRAVLIGTSSYKDERLPPLAAVAASVQALQATLTEPREHLKAASVSPAVGRARRVGAER